MREGILLTCEKRAQVCEYSSLAQTKYMERLSAALKVLFFAMLRDLKLAGSVPPWGQSKELDVEMSKICGARSSDILKRM